MSASGINGLSTRLRAVLLGGVMVFLAACSTSGPASVMAGPGSRDDLLDQAGGATDDPAAGLDNQIVFLRKYPNWYAKLQGFADDPGGEAQMVALSQRRADAVMAYLLANGIAADRLWSKGYGKERVVRECNDRSCKVQNRRVITQLRTEREAGV
jgi:hypothetical protein